MGSEVSTLLPGQLPAQARQEVLDGEPTLKKIAERLGAGKMRHVVVMTGAGISVAAGIPDFRSPETGLYSQLSDLDLPCPEAVFSIDFFRSNPSPFYQLARRLFPGNFSPTDAHFFSVLLQRKGYLLRHYTQNIDNLEVLAGVARERLVEAHGSFADVHCIRCRKQYSIGWFRDEIYSKKEVSRCVNVISHEPVPCSANDCAEYSEGGLSEEGQQDSIRNTSQKESLPPLLSTETPQTNIPADTAAKRADQEGYVLTKRDVLCNGLIKPDITFFGEGLPRRFGMLSPIDLPDCDLLIVLGTSLQVYPFAGLVEMVNPFCPRLLINKEPVGVSDGHTAGFRFFEEDNYRDVFFEGECNDGVQKLCRLLNWEQELNELKEDYLKKVTDPWKLLEDMQLLESSSPSLHNSKRWL